MLRSPFLEDDLVESMYGFWLQGFSTDILIQLRNQHLVSVTSQEPSSSICTFTIRNYWSNYFEIFMKSWSLLYITPSRSQQDPIYLDHLNCRLNKIYHEWNVYGQISVSFVKSKNSFIRLDLKMKTWTKSTQATFCRMLSWRLEESRGDLDEQVPPQKLEKKKISFDSFSVFVPWLLDSIGK